MSSYREKTIRIKVTANANIDLQDLEWQMDACFRLKCIIPTIMLTMGTTDTFGVDEVKPVCELRDRLCEKYAISIKPHIHVDSAIGWSMIFFLAYDFDSNPLDIDPVTLLGLRKNCRRFEQLKYADSFTVDFHKWGYVPYTSSLVMIRDKRDMHALENDPENFSYFDIDLQGHTHLQATIECSRGGAGLFGAYMALKYMGVEGYQVILAHCLQNANYFRECLQQVPGVKVLTWQNQGPAVAFRMYDPQQVEDPAAEFNYEYAIQASEDYQLRLKRNSEWHKALFQRRGKLGLYTNWVEFIARSDYDEHEHFHFIPGEKAIFMNPPTSHRQIDQFIDNILAP